MEISYVAFILGVLLGAGAVLLLFSLVGFTIWFAKGKRMPKIVCILTYCFSMLCFLGVVACVVMFYILAGEIVIV